MSRIDWDEYFLNMCDVVAARSHDQNTKVGCVIVNQYNIVVATGYNGLPAHIKDHWPTDRDKKYGVIERIDNGAMEYIENPNQMDPTYKLLGTVTKYDVMVHAEMNALLCTNQNVRGCTLYSQFFPCHECTKAIITSGIIKVVTRDDPMVSSKWRVSHFLAKTLFYEANVEVKYVKTRSK